VSVAEGWVAGPTDEKDGPWTVEELDVVLPSMIADARANSLTSGRTPEA